MAEILQQLRETTDYIRKICPFEPTVGVVLGSGLGDFTKDMRIEKEIPYEDIPHFPISTVAGHHGKLILGEMAGRKIVAMSGRFHFYEGYQPAQVIYPVRVMKQLGIGTLLVSNAAGGVNPSFRVGDLMIITDHISLAIVNPLLGMNEESLGSRFPDMSEPYKKELVQKGQQIAARMNIPVRQGVYFGVTGPTFETRAEYKMIHLLGADAVGMSTVQEVITAVHMGLPVFAVSVITDLGIREDDNIITHEEVLEAAHAAAPKLASIFREMIATL